MQSHWLFIILLLIITVSSVIANKLTIGAAVTAFVIGSLLYLGTGFTGIWLIGTFFIAGVAATSWKRKQKEQFDPADNKSGRTDLQVIANGGMSGLLGAFSYFLPEHKSLFILMTACSLSSATADTVSSELGTVYGKRFYNIINFKKDTRGENGVVSLEGTLFGIIGSLLIAAIYYFTTGLYQHIIIIAIAGTVGNVCDSILGATFERKGILGNNAVNFLNTLTGALIALTCLL